MIRGPVRGRQRADELAKPLRSRGRRVAQLDQTPKLASDIAHHPLLELLQRPAEPGRDRGRPDPEHRAVVSPSSSSTTRSTTTSRSAADRLRTARSSVGGEALAEDGLVRSPASRSRRRPPAPAPAVPRGSGREPCRGRAGRATCAPRRGAGRSVASAEAPARTSRRRGLLRGVGFRSCTAGSGRRRRGAPRPRRRSSAPHGVLACWLAMRSAPRSHLPIRRCGSLRHIVR